ncbi:hypothetical protein EON66_05520, partial [archaeon]
QGGGAGGHKNWKDRYFVLSDHLYYYTNQAAYQKEPKAPLGRVVLNAYFCSKVDDSTNYEFVINAYPKVRACVACACTAARARMEVPAALCRTWPAPLPAFFHSPARAVVDAASKERSRTG